MPFDQQTAQVLNVDDEQPATRRIVYIRWLDSCGHADHWTKLNDIKFEKGYLDHESCGFLVCETEYSVVVAQNKAMDMANGTGCVESVMEIPKASITEYRIIVDGETVKDSMGKARC